MVDLYGTKSPLATTSLSTLLISTNMVPNEGQTREQDQLGGGAGEEGKGHKSMTLASLRL